MSQSGLDRMVSLLLAQCRQKSCTLYTKNHESLRLIYIVQCHTSVIQGFTRTSRLHIDVGEHVELRARVRVNREIETMVLGYGIKDRLGQVMYGTNTWHTKQTIYNPKAGDEYLFVISFPANLGVGSYSVQIALVDRDTHLTANYEWRDMALVFQVVNTTHQHFAGSIWIPPNISIERYQ